MTQPAKIKRPKLPIILPRTRLFKQLDAGIGMPVSWIAGPAGSGKTTLVSSWIEGRKIPCLWYQIDEGDSDIATFFYYMGLAGKQAAPRHRKPLPLLTPEYLLDVPTFSRRYFENLCSRLRVPFVLVFDNYQLIPASSAFHQILQAGLSSIPERIHAVIVSRSEPNPSYARALANNQMHVIGWEDIRLSTEESKEIIRLKTRAQLDGNAVQYIIERTQGWAAGIVLMIEQMKIWPAKDNSAEIFAPERTFNYFASELFEYTDPQTRDFLLMTSLLPRISVSDAQAITGSGQASEILEGLAKRYFFTVSRSGTVKTYEYHPLFREFLIERARRAYPPPQFREFEKRTAELLMQSGQVEDAAKLFIQSESWEDLSSLVIAHARNLLAQGRSLTVAEWLGSIPVSLTEHNPWLLYWLGISRMTVDLPGSRKLLERAFSIFKEMKDVPGIYLSWCGIINTFVYEWADLTPLDSWIQEIEVLLQQYPVFPSPEIEARVTYGIFCAMMHRQPQHPAISEWAERAMSIALGSGDIQLRTFISGNLILYYSFWRGDTAKASLLVDNLREHAQSTTVDPLSRVVWFGAASANAWIMGENERCLSLVKSGLALAETSGIHVWDFVFFMQCIFVALNLGDVETASRYLQKMSFITRTGRKADIFTYHWLTGWKSLCEEQFSVSLEHFQNALSMQHEGGPMAVAALLQGVSEALIELGDYKAARKHLDEAAGIGAAMKSKTLEDQSYCLDAFFYLRQGNRGKAINSLSRYLAISRESNLMNHAQWRPGSVLELYSLALEEGIEVEHVQKVIRVHQLVPTESQMHLDNWPWPLKMYTFGEFKLLRNNKPLRYSRKAPKKPLELLRVLVALGGRNLSEHRLMDALWPDAEGDSGRKALSVTLARLRELLGIKDALQVSDGMISLDDRFVWTDVRAFERLIRAAERGSGRESNLEKAIELYRAHFLEDENAFWVVSPRERLRESFTHAVQALGAQWERKQEWQKAIDIYRKGVQADDLIEKCYIGMMSCLLRLGSRAEALSVYRQLKKTLEGYGLSPSADAEGLYRQIISGK